MEIELVPNPGAGNPVVQAVTTALAEAGLARDDEPAGTAGAWRRAGLLEAVDRSLTRRSAARSAATPPERGSPSSPRPSRRSASDD